MKRIRVLILSLALAGAALPALSVPTASPAQAASEAQPLKVVLLGDSYSAGNGARDVNGDRDYYGPEDCYRSKSNWAEKYVDHLGTLGYNVTFVNRACSGGVTDNLVNPRKMDSSGGTRLLAGTNLTREQAQPAIEAMDPCNNGYYPDEEYWTYEVLMTTPYGAETLVDYECTRYLVAQTTAVNADTDLVLFTNGGNDIEFDRIVTQCFVTGSRSPSDCREAVDDARDALPAANQGILNAIDQMRANHLREDARVVLLGYPLLALDNGYDLTSWFGLGNDNYQVADEVRALGLDGNAAQTALMTDANAGHPGQVTHLAGVPAHFDGHEPDGSATNRNPDRWIHEFETRIRFEWYHPNPRGHEEYAWLLSQGGTYGADGGVPGLSGDLDVVLAIDTTGSMGADIAQVRSYATTLIDNVTARTSSARFALVTYRDHPEWTGWSGDYPGRVEQGFTNDGAAIKSALDTITVNGGGDWPESMWSGIETGLDLPWRPGVKKVVIVLADAPPHDPEPVSGLTGADIVAHSLAIDPVEVYVVDTAYAMDAALQSVVDGTGGLAINADSAGDVPAALEDALDVALTKPYAWINGPYVAPVGRSVELEASGSYATEGTLTSYAWDFDGDGVVDETTPEPVTRHVWSQPYTGLLTLTVTDSSGRSSVATTHVGITDDGDETPRSADNCPDVDNQGQEDEDGDGVGDLCDETPGWPTEDQEGVTEDDVTAWPFDGFRSPLADPPMLNAARAGRSVPLKFSLGGDRGLDVVAAGYPQVGRVDCSGAAPDDGVVSTTSEPGLTYDAVSDQYVYVWSTDRAWAGSCRRVTLRLTDGSEHHALFDFR